MSDPRLEAHLEAHASGVELELNELTEQLARARTQRRGDEVFRLEQQVVELVDELARTAEAIANPHWDRPVFHGDVNHAA